MQTKKLLLLLLSSLFLALQTYAQTTESQAPFLRLQAHSDGQRILLRWTVSDYETWQKGLESGYRIVRYQSRAGDTLLAGYAMSQTKTVLDTALLAMPESQWDAAFGASPFARVARAALYDPDTSAVATAAPTLADAVDKAQAKDARFLFALFSAEQDFAVAQAMALGLTDSVGLDGGHTYLYRVSLNTDDPAFSGVSGGVEISLSDTEDLPAPEELSGEPADRAVYLQWRTAGVDEHYSSYDVERSTDSLNFAKVNELPFLFAGDGEEDPDYAVFRDSLADNATVYYYRVRGRTAFGMQGPPSEAIALRGRPSRLAFSLRIDSTQATQTTVDLFWSLLPDSLHNQLQGFNVYRSEQPDAHFEKVNSNILSSSVRSWRDTAPVAYGYYRLEAVDENGYAYQSPAVLASLTDTIPPAAPQGLTGRFITKDRVELQWQANTEEDLQGYRLFAANEREGVFMQITSFPVSENRYVYPQRGGRRYAAVQDRAGGLAARISFCG